MSSCEFQLIPTTFHWVWLSEKPLPAKDATWLSSWQRHHPDWECVIWADSPATVNPPSGFEVRPLPPLLNQISYDTVQKWVGTRAIWAARSDIVRYEVVARFGGIYLDTDVECFRNIELLLHHVRLFYADEWGPRHGNYMFGAISNHPAMWSVVRDLGPHLAKYKGDNAVGATGPAYFAPQLRKDREVVIFPHMLFNPLSPWADYTQVQSWPACSYANHHYDGKWYDRTKKAPPAEFLTVRSSP